MKFVLSTMTQNVSYNLYNTDDPQNPIFIRGVIIRGGAGIASSRSGFGDQQEDAEGRPIWTADGFVTPVSDDDMALLLSNPIFIKHQERGLVRVLDKDITGNHRAVKKEAATMERDGFQPLNKDRLKQKVKVATGFAEQHDQFRI